MSALATPLRWYERLSNDRFAWRSLYIPDMPGTLLAANHSSIHILGGINAQGAFIESRSVGNGTIHGHVQYFELSIRG